MFLGTILKYVNDDTQIEIYIGEVMTDKGKAKDFRNNGLIGNLLVDQNSIKVENETIQFHFSSDMYL